MVRQLRLLVIVATSLVVASSCSGSPDAGIDTGSQQGVTTEALATDPPEAETTEAVDADAGSEAQSASACTPSQDGSDLLDQDMSDHQVPWQRNGADKVAIYFESGDVNEEYRGYLDDGAAAWNRSPCLDVRIVDACPDDVNCVTVALTGGDDADGNFESIERGGFTVGGHIDLFVEELDKLGDGAKLNVTIHEMGHAVGLRHRQTERVLMNGDTYTDIFDPDDTDYRNLRVLYGNQE